MKEMDVSIRNTIKEEEEHKTEQINENKNILIEEDLLVQNSKTADAVTDMSELTKLRQKSSGGEMDAIKARIADVERLMDSENSFEEFSQVLDDAITACSTYLRNKNPWTTEGQRRKEIVRRTQHKFFRLKELYSAALEKVKEYPEGDILTKPSELIRFGRINFTDDELGAIELKCHNISFQELKKVKDREDGREMSEAKESYNVLTNLLLNTKFTSDMNVNMAALAAVDALYDDTMKKCQAYISVVKKKGRAHTVAGQVRLDAVTNIVSECRYMRVQMKNLIKAYEQSDETKKDLAGITTFAGLYSFLYSTYPGKKEPGSDIRLEGEKAMKVASEDIQIQSEDTAIKETREQELKRVAAKIENPGVEIVDIEVIEGKSSEEIKKEVEDLANKYKENWDIHVEHIEGKSSEEIRKELETLSKQKGEKLKEWSNARKKTAEENNKLLTQAYLTNDKKKFIAAIEKVTGVKNAAIYDLPYNELAEFLYVLHDDAYVTKNMASSYKTALELINEHIKTDYTEDDIRDKVLDNYGILTNMKKKKEIPDESTTDAVKGYGLIYLRKALEDDSISGKDIAKISIDDLYKLTQFMGVVKALTGTEDEYEKADLLAARKVVGQIALKSEKLKDAVFKKFKLDEESIRETKKEIKNLEVPIEVELMKGDKLKAYGKVSTKSRYRKKLKEDNEKKAAEIAARAGRAVPWSKDAQATLNMVGDLVKALGSRTADYKTLLKDNAKVLILIANEKISAKEGDNIGAVAEIRKSLSKQDGTVVDGMLNALKKFADTMKETAEKQGLEFSANNLKGLLTDDAMNGQIGTFETDMKKAVKEGEKAIQEAIDEATKDIFDQDQDEALEPLLAKEKSKEEKQKDESYELIRMNNKLRYDNKRGQGKFIQTLVKDYYKRSSVADQRLMLSYVIKDLKKEGLEKNLAQTGGSYFASTLKGAGPLMQKIMQGVPDQLVVPEMREAINVVKSDLGDIDRNYIDEKVYPTLIQNAKVTGTDIKIGKSLGAASVAQTFLCTVTIPGKKKEPPTTQQVVLKVLRPEAEARMQKELDFIRECARKADMTDEEIKNYDPKKQYEMRVTESGFLAQYEEIKKEFDFNNEVINAKRGAKNYNNPKKKVKSVAISNSFKSGKSYLIMEKAEGETLDKCVKRYKDTETAQMQIFKNRGSVTKSRFVVTSENVGKIKYAKRELKKQSEQAYDYANYAGDLARVWVEQAIFGSFVFSKNGDNFHHGDLHSGNIMVSKDGTTVLDYGNARVFTDNKVDQILNMMAASVVGNTDYFVEAFEKLLNIAIAEDTAKKKKGQQSLGLTAMTSQQKEMYAGKLKDLFKKGGKNDTGKKIIISLSLAQQCGIKLPLEIQNFSQCQQRLENSLNEVIKSAVDLTADVEMLDHLPVAEEDKKSLDPRIQFHIRGNEKNSDGEYRKTRFVEEEMYHEYGLNQSKKYKKASLELASVKDKKSADDFIKNYMPDYGYMKEGADFKDIAKLVDELKTYYALLEDAINKGLKPSQWPKELLDMRVTFEVHFSPVVLSGIYCSSAKGSELVSLRSKGLDVDGQKVDRGSYEKLLYFFEKELPATYEMGKAIENMSKEKDGFSYENCQKIKAKYDEYLGTLNKNLDKNREVSRRLDAVKDTASREALEKELKGMFEYDGYLKTVFDKYFDKRSEYEKLQGEPGTGEKEKAKEELDKLKEEFLQIFSEIASSMIELQASDRKTHSREYPEDPKEVRESLYDFMEVMMDVLWDHKPRLIKKLGIRYKAEFAKLEEAEAEAKKEEQGEGKTEEKKEDKKVEKKADKKEDKKETKKETKKKK